MNDNWIVASHKSARDYKSINIPSSVNIFLVRKLDIMGLFETSWLIYPHEDNRFGYPGYE